MEVWLQALIGGILLGGLYALYATGLSLAFGVMRLVNIAHGDLIVLGAYLGLVATGVFGLSPLAALPVIAVIMAGMGYVLQLGVLNHTLGRDILPPLLVTFGLSIIIENALLQGFSADTQHLPSMLQTASLPLGGSFYIGWLPLLTLAIAVGLIIVLQLLFSRTALGRAFAPLRTTPRQPL